ncbi:hypothetical protein [Pararhizobium haloflavum]|uniref:hypothetical protein n=1 Tax=Pararhizobium haloflavum TaxID=2037914 RepID=UPI000C190A8D|nr:hypothetical protein [Pararhizobium haloflavum]
MSIASKLLGLVLAVTVALLVASLSERPFAHAPEHGHSHVHAAGPGGGAPCNAGDRHCCQPAHCLALFSPAIQQAGLAPVHGVRPASVSLPLISIDVSGIDPPPKVA